MANCPPLPVCFQHLRLVVQDGGVQVPLDDLVVFDGVPLTVLQVGVQKICLRYSLSEQLNSHTECIHWQIFVVESVVLFCCPLECGAADMNTINKLNKVVNVESSLGACHQNIIL